MTERNERVSDNFQKDRSRQKWAAPEALPPSNDLQHPAPAGARYFPQARGYYRPG